MDKFENHTNSDFEIQKIVPVDHDKYDVYFSFLDIPVTMNKAFMENVINNSNNNKFLNQKYR